MLDTLVHGETAFLAGVAQEIRIGETVLGEESGFENGHRIVFETPAHRRLPRQRPRHRQLPAGPDDRPGPAPTDGRRRAASAPSSSFDYRVVARRFVQILSRATGDLVGID